VSRKGQVSRDSFLGKRIPQTGRDHVQIRVMHKPDCYRVHVGGTTHFLTRGRVWPRDRNVVARRGWPCHHDRRALGALKRRDTGTPFRRTPMKMNMPPTACAHATCTCTCTCHVTCMFVHGIPTCMFAAAPTTTAFKDTVGRNVAANSAPRASKSVGTPCCRVHGSPPRPSLLR